ncbi:AmmeMemoRadiSam system protein A [Sulfurimonas sp.]|uniref:AmmeMemoRadiSam system protein A n=1 Tax=Sulfurimonas sp. TaxID=2022749 RepID=UPI00356961C7
MLDPILLKIAKTAILSRFDDSFVIDKDLLLKEYPFLNKDGASFVTLNYNGALRGCIGSIIAHRTLLDDIISNANSAAFSDPRFSPLKTDELDKLNLEVSVLTKPELLNYKDYNDLKDKINAGTDGLILKYGSYQGTFLPQVWEQLPDKERFLEHLSYKAGTNPSIYEHNPDIYVYQVDAIEEDFDAVLPL